MKTRTVAVCLACVVTVMTGLVACTPVVTEIGKGATKQLSKDEQVRKLVGAASDYIAQENQQRAKELLRRALEIEPRSPEAHHMLALAFWATGEDELAEQNFKDAISYKSDFTQAHLNYSSFLIQGGKYKEARKQLEAALEDALYDKRSAAFMMYGTVLAHLGELPAAAEAHKRSLALDRANAQSMVALASIYYQLADFDQALRYYRQFRLNGKQTAPSLLLGIRLAEKTGNSDDKASYELALKNLFPDSPESKGYFGAAQPKPAP